MPELRRADRGRIDQRVFLPRLHHARLDADEPKAARTKSGDRAGRLPGRIDAAETAYASTADLSSALRRAAVAHGEHEKRTGAADPNWPEWYAAYMVAERAGETLPL